jgi:hypothetical protein
MGRPSGAHNLLLLTVGALPERGSGRDAERETAYLRGGVRVFRARRTESGAFMIATDDSTPQREAALRYMMRLSELPALRTDPRPLPAGLRARRLRGRTRIGAGGEQAFETLEGKEKVKRQEVADLSCTPSCTPAAPPVPRGSRTEYGDLRCRAEPT